VRDIVSSEKDIKDETREKLALLSSTARYSRGFDSPGDRLNTINEMNTTGSLLASFDITTERTEEELELSMVRSSRPSRMKRASEGAYVNTESSNKRYKSSKEVLTFYLVFLFFSVYKLVICSFFILITE
jgi:Rac GTPase-activating protein 1